MEYFDIVIIDSGVNAKHKEFTGQNLYGFSMKFSSDGQLVINRCIEDLIGHGTAVYSIIQKNVKNKQIKILNVNIFNCNESIDENILCAALKYIRENINCKIINISMGLTSCSNRQELYNVCSSLSKSNVFLIAAFDNDGAVSYPAAFDCVIGVDASPNCKNVSEYEFVENSIINLRAKGGIQKLAWTTPEYVIVQGSSFACAYMSANILNLLNEYSYRNTAELMSFLKQHATTVHLTSALDRSEIEMFFQPYKVLLFPFNKEIHSLVRFNHLTNFNIYSIADVRMTGRVNKKVNQLINQTADMIIGDLVVQDLDGIDWSDDFDTIIVGHVDILNELLHRNLVEECLYKCVKYKKT